MKETELGISEQWRRHGPNETSFATKSNLHYWKWVTPN